MSETAALEMLSRLVDEVGYISVETFAARHPSLKGLLQTYQDCRAFLESKKARPANDKPSS